MRRVRLCPGEGAAVLPWWETGGNAAHMAGLTTCWFLFSGPSGRHGGSKRTSGGWGCKEKEVKGEPPPRVLSTKEEQCVANVCDGYLVCEGGRAQVRGAGHFTDIQGIRRISHLTPYAKPAQETMYTQM